MRAKKFSKGQHVTPGNDWENREIDGGVPWPSCHLKRGEIYTVNEYYDFNGGHWWVSLVEKPRMIKYCETTLEPVITTEELEKELSSIPETAKV